MPDSPGASEVGGGLDGLYLNLGDARKAISEKEAEERRKKLQNETWVGELGQTRLLNLLYMVKKHQGHLPNTGGLNMAKKFDAVKLELEKTDCFKGHPGMDGMSYKKKWERVRDDFIKKNAPEANNSGNAPPTETERLIAELLMWGSFRGASVPSRRGPPPGRQAAFIVLSINPKTQNPPGVPGCGNSQSSRRSLSQIAVAICGSRGFHHSMLSSNRYPHRLRRKSIIVRTQMDTR